MTTKNELLKIIRLQCVTCCGGSFTEVKMCEGGRRTNEYTTCHIHPFRFGTDPYNKVTEAKREQGRKLAENRNHSTKSTQQNEPVSLIGSNTK